MPLTGTSLFIIPTQQALLLDRKSTRLNSSHSQISYAVFCLKKKKELHSLMALIFLLQLDFTLTDLFLLIYLARLLSSPSLYASTILARPGGVLLIHPS